MTTIKQTDCWRGAGFALLAAGALLLWPATALARTDCSTDSAATLCADTATYPVNGDCDDDGFTNGQECLGFTTITGKPVAGFTSTDAAIPAADRLDPTKPDLFYLVSNMNNGDLTATFTASDGSVKNSLLFIALASEPNALKVYSDGLEVRTHLIKSADCDSTRLLTGTVRAARIRENLGTVAEGTYLGSTLQGNPSDANVVSTIYTQKIKNNVDYNCPTTATIPIGNTACSVKNTSPLVTNVNGTNNTPITNYYIRQVIAHEMGHGSHLADAAASTYYHYAKSGTVMDPAATFARGVYTIPTAYNLAKDPAALLLH